MKRLRFAFLGSTYFSKVLLLSLIEENHIPTVIFSAPEKFSISYSKHKVKNYNYAYVKGIADKYQIRYYEVDSCNGKRLSDYQKIIERLDLDLILVLGWYYMIPKSIRELANLGAWGIHASLLPKYAGGAPLTWAIINGEKETGVTLFRMKDGVDDGDIIRQKSFPIEDHDNIKKVYNKAIKASIDILMNVLKNVGAVKFVSQDKSEIQVYPQRKPEDGELNLSMTAREMYNFIRAQSDPYPGAYIKTLDNKKIVIEKARIEDL